MKNHGTHFIHASDEWYLLAEWPLPEADNYDGYIQLENGVGMIRLLMDEFEEAMRHLAEEEAGGETDEALLPDRTRVHRLSLATGFWQHRS